MVLIAQGAELLHHVAYGTTMYIDPGSQPVQLDTIYDIASLTKMFTATAALRLSEASLIWARRLRLSARVSRIGCDDPACADAYLRPRYPAFGAAARRPRRMLDAVYHTAPIHPPGSTVAYTNVNSLLLGEVVARLHGAPLHTALRDLVIDPLGLHDTLFRPPPALLRQIAPTERDEEWRGALVHGSVHDESTHALGGVAGHAGLFSTAADLDVFCRMWLEAIGDWRLAIRDWAGTSSIANRLSPIFLRSDTARLAVSNHTAGLHAACGLGWMPDRPNFMGAAPAGSFGHTGFTGSAIIVVPGRRLIVVLLSNRVYPRRRAFEHHPVTAALLHAALANVPGS